MLNASAAAGRLKFSEGSLVHTPDGDVSGASRDTERSIYAVSADVSWELDFFGRIRRATEAQNAGFLGTLEARRAAVLSLVADVARVYFEIRDLDRRLEVARRTNESRREYVQFAKDRFEGGVTAEIDYSQAEAELRRVETVVFDLERLVTSRRTSCPCSWAATRNRSPAGRAWRSRSCHPRSPP